MNMALDQNDVGQVALAGETDDMVTLQNLGPGDVYLDRNDDVSSTTGLKMEPDTLLTIPNGDALWVVAIGGDADLRILGS